MAASAGLDLDPWQCLTLDDALGERADGTWAAFEVGLVVSRQNGKGGILEARELAGLYLFGERLIIHSAHLFDTSMEAMNRIMQLIESTPDLDREVKRVSRSHGEEGIELFGNRRLRFKTRTKGGGRGLSADTVIIDEAMYLPAQTVAALLPTMSARPNPQIWYTGSAGEKDSLHLAHVRDRGMEASDPRLCYLEWSIDGCTDECRSDCEDHDPPDSVTSYAKANPALGIRLSVEHIESERKAMEPVDFARERLGMGEWPVEAGWQVIRQEAWEAVEDPASRRSGQIAIGIDVTPDRGMGCIAIAGRRIDRKSHLEVVAHQPGTRWMVDEIERLVKKHRPAAVVINDKGAAASLIPDLEDANIKLIKAGVMEMAGACGDLHDGIVRPRGVEEWEPSVRVFPNGALTAAVSSARKRKLGESWAWGRSSESADISPLVAVTLARWGHAKFAGKTRKPMVAAV